MYRSLPSSSDSVFSFLGEADDFEIVENVFSGHEDGENVYPDVIDASEVRTLNSRVATVVGVDSNSGLYSDQHHRDNVNLTEAGHYRDIDAKVKDFKPGYYYLYAEGKQDLDFSNFEANIHKTSSSRDLTETSEEGAVFSMAPVITVTPPNSPSRQTVSFRHLQPDMLGMKTKTRRYSHSSGFSTPSGSLTPTGMQTPTGMRTPSGMLTPTGFTTPKGYTPGLKRSSSTANLIHFHNLETVNVSDLYTQLSDGNPGMNINQNIPHDKDVGRSFSRSPQRYDNFQFDKKYKSHSCPHSRHHSPPRQQRHRIETVNEADSLPDIVTASGGTNGNIDLKDVNFNDTDDIKIINDVDDNLTARHELHSSVQNRDGSYSGQGSESLSFADLFLRCRYERDTSVPNTPYEGDHHVVDPEQLMNRVNYFLSSERVSQMTKTYNDIDAVTRLLEEKENDLELAARIGQTLLSKNKELSARTDVLEEQLGQVTEEVNQLRHLIVKKDELLSFYNEEHETSGDTTPSNRSMVNMDFLEKKVKTLEEENVNLRLESEELKSETDNYEEKEKRLVEDLFLQLADVNLQVEALSEELHQKVEENAHHKEEITGHLAQIADLQLKIRKLTLENMEIHEKLTASTESQRRLTKELGIMQDKYDELFEMLEDAQDELKTMRGKHKVRSSGQHHHSAYSVPTDSLASELETSLQQELSQPRRRSYNWKVFETAKAAKRAAAKAAQRKASPPTRVPLAHPILRESDSQGPSAYPSDAESLASDGYSADMDSLYGSNPELGQPGIPGSSDLESALKRLAIGRANEQNEKDFHEEEEERRRNKLLASSMSGGTSPWSVRSPVPYALRSPAGSVSSSNWSSTGMPMNNHHYKLSEKLQIVKPMEGSMTLRHWQHLATPHLGGIFEERDGVQIKGEKKLDLVEEIYSLSDYEEDGEEDDTSLLDSQKEQDMSSGYIFTDSTVGNPGSYRGQGSLFGSSTPVNSHMNTLTGEDQRIDINTEPQHTQSTDTSKKTNVPLGLASLLQGRENTEVGRALMRVSALKRAVSTNESSASSAPVSASDFNQTVLSSRSFGNHPFPSSIPRNIPGSRSFDQAMREYEEKRKVSAEEKPLKKPELFAPGMTGKGFLQQLKSKGYSLYGLWGGGASSNQSDAESSADRASSTGDGSTSSIKASNETLFSNGAGVGVLGALTNFRRNGMF